MKDAIAVQDWGMEQIPDEIGRFLDEMTALGVRSLLEIGTGSGGLARYCVEVLGWDVTSVDVQRPANPAGSFVPVRQGEYANFERTFDLVFIDAVHSYSAVSADHLHYAPYAAKAVAFHDIANPRPTCEGSGQYWREISAPPSAVAYHEIIAAVAQPAGIGWYTVEVPEMPEDVALKGSEPIYPRQKPSAKKARR